jgi:hypothetical protein|tara:strand:- start:563 stop:802 length:240 start_codon:yes stop_codon:yes gene_type:complete
MMRGNKMKVKNYYWDLTEKYLDKMVNYLKMGTPISVSDAVAMTMVSQRKGDICLDLIGFDTDVGLEEQLEDFYSEVQNG